MTLHYSISFVYLEVGSSVFAVFRIFSVLVVALVTIYHSTNDFLKYVSVCSFV